MPTSRSDRRTAAREGILAAAHRQLADAGCASASVAAVAARAGVAAGTLYRHFPSRAELLAEVVGDALRAEHALLAAAGAAPAPRAALEAWVRLAAARAAQAPRLAFALAAEPCEPEVEAVRRREGLARQETLAALLARGSAAGAWPAGDAALQAAAIAGALHAVLVEPAGAGASAGSGPDVDALVGLVLGAVA